LYNLTEGKKDRDPGGTKNGRVPFFVLGVGGGPKVKRGQKGEKNGSKGEGVWWPREVKSWEKRKEAHL